MYLNTKKYGWGSKCQQNTGSRIQIRNSLVASSIWSYKIKNKQISSHKNNTVYRLVKISFYKRGRKVANPEH